MTITTKKTTQTTVKSQIQTQNKIFNLTISNTPYILNIKYVFDKMFFYWVLVVILLPSNHSILTPLISWINIGWSIFFFLWDKKEQPAFAQKDPHFFLWPIQLDCHLIFCCILVKCYMICWRETQPKKLN